MSGRIDLREKRYIDNIKKITEATSKPRPAASVREKTNKSKKKEIAIRTERAKLESIATCRERKSFNA